MRITWRELAIEADHLSIEELLSEWRWLVPENLNLVLVSSLGNAFLQDNAGAVHWLDTGAAKLTLVAESVAHFNELRQQPENANNWFMPQLIGNIIQGGSSLEPNQVFSYKLLPTLNGRYEPSNFEPTDVSVHFHIHGSVQRQISTLPEGTVISKFVVEQ